MSELNYYWIIQIVPADLVRDSLNKYQNPCNSNKHFQVHARPNRQDAVKLTVCTSHTETTA